MRFPVACLALTALLSGCTEISPPRWETIVNSSGTNACDSPIGRVLILTHFNVRHQRFFANFTVALDVGVVEFQIADPFSEVRYRREFRGPGSDSALIDQPMDGIWQWQVNCPAAVQVNLEWELQVDAMTKP